MPQDPKTITIAAVSTVLAIGALTLSIWNIINKAHKAYMHKIQVVHQYVLQHGELESQQENKDQERFVFRISHDGGLLMEYNHGQKLRHLLYEAAVQGASKFAKDVARETIGIKKRSEFRYDSSNVPLTWSEFTDADLNGPDNGDTYHELKLVEAESTEPKYKSALKTLATIASDTIKSMRGQEPDSELADPNKAEPVELERRITASRYYDSMIDPKQEKLRDVFKNNIETAYKLISGNFN